jgi:3-dehydroquinate synthase
VALGERAYPVVIGCELGDRLAARVAELPGHGGKVALISDTVVTPLHAARFEARLVARGLNVTRLVVPAGEQAKTLEVAATLYDQLIAAGADRRTPVVALGGGVVTDLGGFVASTLYRGLPVVHVPTTVIGQLDAAIGGKTAVDTPRGKNLVGTFHQPAGVFADARTLLTLPRRDLLAGLSEALKSGAIGDAALFELMEREAPRLSADTAHTPEALLPVLVEIVARAAAVKVAIVVADERELLGERAKLNLGHTLGHALETASARHADAIGDPASALRHGEAVALGMCAVAQVAERTGRTTSAEAARLVGAVRALGLPHDWQAEVAAAPGGEAALRQLLAVDKKRAAGKITVILPVMPGQVVLSPMTIDELWGHLQG